MEEQNPWDLLPKSLRGRPQITVSKPPVDSLISQGMSGAQSWLNAPPQIKPDRPPENPYQEPSQAIGEGLRGVGSHYVQSLKDLASPFAKGEDDKYVADKNLPEEAYKGKVPQVQKDVGATSLPVAAEVLGTFGGVPGTGLGWGAAKTVGAAMLGAAAKKAATKVKPWFDHGFLDTSSFVQHSKSKGTMPGGFMADPKTGTEYYVKQAPDMEQAKNEKLTAELYKLMGVPVAEVHLTSVNGKPGIASKKIDGSLQLSYSNTPYEQISGLHENYPIHAWLANHDAVGTGPENPLGNIMVKDGEAYVIDTGGGLLYKGTGTKKAKFSPEVDEISTMADPNYSHLSAEVFGGVDPAVAKVGAQRLANVPDEAIAQLVEKYGPSNVFEKMNLLNTLLKRKHNVMQHYGVQPGGKIEVSAPKPEPRPEPAPDDWGKPLNEEEWQKFLDENEPPLPDDVSLPMEPVFRPESAKAKESKVNPFDLPFHKVLGAKGTAALMGGHKWSTTGLKETAKALVKDTSGINHWDGAVNLWQIAEHINPQTAEALFRNLPPSIQPQVGYAIAALKNELAYSPWNSLAKGSGKDGKYPSDFNYYTTQTTVFPVPDHLKKSKAFLDNIKHYAAKLKPEEYKQTKPPLFEHDVLDSMVTNVLDANQANPKLIHEYLKNLNDPAMSEEIFKGLPPDIRKSIDDIIAVERSETPAPKTQYEKDVAEYEAKLDSVLDKPEKKAKNGQPLYQWLVNADSFAINKHFEKLAKPIDNWTTWKPAKQLMKPPTLVHATPEQIKELGFNPNMEFYHSSHFEVPEILGDPRTIKSTDDERAFFTADQPIHSLAYGPNLKSYVARAPKAVEVNWEDFSGALRYSHGAMKALIEAGHRQGLDLIIAKKVRDVSHNPQGVDIYNQYLFLKTQNLRQTIAKFDPNKLHLSHTMAGLAGGGIFVYGDLKGGDKGDGMNQGGTPLNRIRSYARGGPGSHPWNVRQKSHPKHPAGMIKSDIPGRTDKIPMSVPPGSYILPADIPSALGQGNTMAGEKILGNMFKSGPYSPGAAQVTGKSRRASASMPKMSIPKMRKAAAGGEQTGNEPDIPIIAAGGEVVLYPEQVAQAGHGNMEAGHRVLDKFVLSVRKRHIETLKKLKPPKK